MDTPFDTYQNTSPEIGWTKADGLYEAHLHALHMFEKLIQFIPDSLSPTCHINITSAAGEPVLTVFLPALAAEERFQWVLAHHLQRARAWPC